MLIKRREKREGGGAGVSANDSCIILIRAACFMESLPDQRHANNLDPGRLRVVREEAEGSRLSDLISPG